MPAAGVLAEAAGAPPPGVTAIKMSAEQPAQPRAAAAPALLNELHDNPVQADGIVQGDDTLLLVAEDLVQIGPTEGHEGRSGIGGSPGEFYVEGGQKALAQVPVRPRRRPDLGHPEFVDEAILQRAVHPLAPAAGLRGIAQDVLDAQALQGAADL